MANTDPIFLGTTANVGVLITSADALNKVTAYTADATEGGAVTTLSGYNTDAVNDRTVIVSYNDGTNSFTLGEVIVTADSTVDLFSGLPALNEDGAFILKPGGILEVAAKVAVTSNIEVAGIAGNY